MHHNPSNPSVYTGDKYYKEQDVHMNYIQYEMNPGYVRLMDQL